MRKVLFLTVGVLLFGICQVNAQNEKPYWGLYGAISLPRGDFGDNVGSDAGLAKTGFGVGIECTFPLNSPGISWVTNVSFILNGVDEDTFEDTFNETFYYSDINVYKLNVDAGDWINFPFLTGIKYQSKVSSNMSLFGMAQAGLNFVKGPEFEISGSGYDYDYGGYKLEITSTMDFATSFGFSVGGGIILNDKFIIGLRYLNLGEPDIKGTVKVNVDGESEKEEFEGGQSISLFLLTVGMKF